MIPSTIIGLINNTALLMALALIYDIVILRQPGQKASLNQVPLGIILGFLGIGVMIIGIGIPDTFLLQVSEAALTELLHMSQRQIAA